MTPTHQRCRPQPPRCRLWRSWLWLLCMAWIMPAQAVEPLVTGPKDFPIKGYCRSDRYTCNPAQAIQQLRNQPPEWQQEGFSRSYTRITLLACSFVCLPTAFNGNSRWLGNRARILLMTFRLYLKPANSQTRLAITAGLAIFTPNPGTPLPGIPRLDYRGAVFSLPATTQQQDYDVLVRLQSSSTMMFFIRLWQPEDFLRYSGKATAFWSFLYRDRPAFRPAGPGNGNGTENTTACGRLRRSPVPIYWWSACKGSGPGCFRRRLAWQHYSNQYFYPYHLCEPDVAVQ